MEFEIFSKRINSLVNFDRFEKPPSEYKEGSRLTVDKGKMVKKKKKDFNFQMECILFLSAIKI